MLLGPLSLLLLRVVAAKNEENHMKGGGYGSNNGEGRKRMFPSDKGGAARGVVEESTEEAAAGEDMWTDKNYKHLVETSSRNNRVVCVQKEFNDLIYYKHDKECDPNNTFSFSFNSTFKFDTKYYERYKENKKSFVERNINPHEAVGSCINCLFLDEMNFLSIYGHTFIYDKSEEAEYKEFYERMIDMHYVTEGKGNSLEVGTNGVNVLDSSAKSWSYHGRDNNSHVLQESNCSMGSPPFSNRENSILENFLRDNRIHYAYDEIGDGGISEGEKSGQPCGATDLVMEDTSLNSKMVDNFFMNFKTGEISENGEEVDNHEVGKHNRGEEPKKVRNLSKPDESNTPAHIKDMPNLIFDKEKCRIFREDINKKKIWSNILLVNSFTNLNILSHIDKYKGRYKELKYFWFHENYKKRKLNNLIRTTLDLNDQNYFINNNVFILIANDEIKFLDEVTFCGSYSSDDEWSLSYVTDKSVLVKYERIKRRYNLSDHREHNRVFLIKVMYHEEHISLILIDYITGLGDPMKLSIPFFYLASHEHFSQYTHFFMKDNLIGWISKGKMLYITAMRKIFSYLRESASYTDKPYDVITVENKIISNVYLLYLSHDIFKYVLFARYNPLKDSSLHKNIPFEAALLSHISTFTQEELSKHELYFRKITKKEIKDLDDPNKESRMDVFDIFIIPSSNYIKFQQVLSTLFKALFDCGGKHISMLLKIATVRSHYDMLYNFNCYNYQLHSFLVNLIDLHEHYYEHTELDALFRESQRILLRLVKLTLDEMNNLIPFNEDKELVKYLIIILYFGNDMFCLDKENSIYLQLIYELRHLNIHHAILVAYLSGDKSGTLCSEERAIEVVPHGKAEEDDQKWSAPYITFEDQNAYLKPPATNRIDVVDPIAAFLNRFDNRHFGDFHVTIKSDKRYSLSIFIVSYMASVIFIIGELNKKHKVIYVYRIFKNVYLKNYPHNITKYYTFWNTQLYAFAQYEPECVLLFHKYSLYEKYSSDGKYGSDREYRLGGEVQRAGEVAPPGGQSDALKNNRELMNHFAAQQNSCLCYESMINKSKGEFVVSEYLELRHRFMKRIKKKKKKKNLYEKMKNYNFFNDPLEISYKTRKFENEKLVDICKDMTFEKNHLCMFHKSRIILTYLYLLTTSPEYTFYVISPLVFIKPKKYCNEYDIPLVLNNILKNRSFFKKSSKICINYAFAHFISSGNKTNNFIVTAKISGTMVNVSKNNLLLLLPLRKRVDILDHSTNKEYDIKEEILNEYFILGNPYIPISVISYSYGDYNEVKKNEHSTIAGAFIKRHDQNFVVYRKMTTGYDKIGKHDEKKKPHQSDEKNSNSCAENHSFEMKGKILCFCDVLRTKKKEQTDNCVYPFCEQNKRFCYFNERCVDGKCVCIEGYSRNPMSSLCEKNNECILSGESNCKEPGKCVFAQNRYVCLCPHPYVRVLNNCLHPLKGIKIGLRIFNHFQNDFSNDEDDASKKEKFYTNVFGSMSEYLKEVIKSVIDPALTTRIHVKPIEKLKNGIKATIIINQRSSPEEPTPIQVFNIFLNQLGDSTSELNNGFYAYFARFTYIEYVKSFSKDEGSSPFYDHLLRYVPTFFVNMFEVDAFNDISIIACINFFVLVIVTFSVLFYFFYLFLKMKFFRDVYPKGF
ncbi:conserved Plasmodium protein, unknown function [Plasmodium knowlesi strain H]|uniref:EGF-like domain-containing protein n=3 Tax=Plasmodium knowlesi TaxID=5850 RepID=A0A5K1TUW3_PLAKH|nr:conserved Plasmodium protein, unknown function [Plasmodium knowlesi strain H]OTN67377.1 Uncharacterized protein PKNOH_S06418200 [Plasmodium knowlesi]CAA9987455.1 conserved Plasmodium protein, unknown function [Plasmodium knowlesi strain H]SBO23234.1 conserved Plasmodium protein, unknown function [Plasmodium knowlesi strain H]SBO24074.1 conserved Plasmodium protein, unknown function [Plasmodium knowlesi strain H]VVS76929.1 conserved Plasmodium protein, unknown function [Plasmodium knowlesi s|eukprot:XP_002258456.1 hypothetical protein, conserved in Plasmodium species [Plasmodium knowlesi strain H]